MTRKAQIAKLEILIHHNSRTSSQKKKCIPQNFGLIFLDSSFPVYTIILNMKDCMLSQLSLLLKQSGDDV